ncbi:SDR family NAD(P)-dependent oxidoreductase [Fodinibius sp. AD559]|uniref:SDR family NAD(P)-dependent oxidoreductase n=1 Tax=Fodinibius sp. AD559 TaxID=3424179 RepID=UPI0040469706
MKRVDNKVIIVTGAASGIGKKTSQVLASEGAKVAITDIQDDTGQEVAEQITNNGGTAKYWHMDTTDEEEVKDAFTAIEDEFGSIDGLVNNAGIEGVDKPTHEITMEEWQQVIDVNVNGVFLCTKYAVPAMKKAGGGSIINLSSIYGLVGAADLPPYHASKGAVHIMSKNDALLYAEDNIRVNSVHPGFIWTSLVERVAKEQEGVTVEEFREELAEAHPIGHVGDPEDIANGILYLSSDESKFVTGSALVIDGGYTAQ